MKRIILIVAFSFCVVGSAFSQEQESQIVATDTLEEVTYLEDKYADKYQESNIQNFSKLYWLKNVFSFDDDTAIDNFVMINECDFYQQYLKDDFNWEKVRDATREIIKEDIPTYSDKYKIIVPVDLGRYDPKKKGFPIINGTQFEDLRHVEVGGRKDRVCGRVRDVKKYPRSISFILNEPLSYKFVSIDEDVAQALILRDKNKSILDKPKELRSQRFNRLVFARVRMSFLQYQGVVTGDNKRPASTIFGEIDGIDIFENQDETGLLSTVDF